MNYDFTQKNHWRNRIWNQMAERVPCHPRDAIILYLAAESDFDRPTAIRKGFRLENLIAVDRDQRVVDRLRAEGALAVCGDIMDVVRAWPASVPVGGVIADFCCGLEPSIISVLSGALLTKQFQGARITVNLLRGRDHRTNSEREILSCPLFEAAKTDRKYAQCEKHRGLLFAVSYISVLMALDKKRGGAYTKEVGWLVESQMMMDHGSYKSTAGQYFDWAAFNTLSAGVFDCPVLCADLLGPLAQLRRSISAVLAHRTRRLAA